MRDTFLSFSPPMLGEEEIAEVVDTLRSDWITTGPKVTRFEAEFAKYLGADAALALSSGTAALHVGLCALGIGPGDRVICSPMTFCSSIHVVEQVGAVPVLVDVEHDTLNLDPERVEEAVRATPGVRAIQPVHLYGHPCDLDALLQIAERFRLALLQDAAHALPATYGGRLIGSRNSGSVPDLTAFSFYATKNLTTAEGGMLTGPSELINKARVWSLHGMSRDAYKRYSEAGSWYYEVVVPGFKYNMTDIQAALGIHQLRRLPEMQRRRREIAERYQRAFAPVEELELPAQRPGIDSARHLFVIRLRTELLNIDRAGFIEELKRYQIGSSVHFIPVHVHPYYRQKYGFQPDDFPIAHREYGRIISLPLYPRMTDQDVTDVIDAVKAVVERHRR